MLSCEFFIEQIITGTDEQLKKKKKLKKNHCSLSKDCSNSCSGQSRNSHFIDTMGNDTKVTAAATIEAGQSFLTVYLYYMTFAIHRPLLL